MSEEYRIDNEAASAAEGSAASEDDRLDLNQLFELLSKERRRYALYCFKETSKTEMSLNALVDRLRSFEGVETATETQREELKLALQHTHLPKLADAAVIDYDPSDATIEFTGGARLERWIHRAAEAELE